MGAMKVIVDGDAAKKHGVCSMGIPPSPPTRVPGRSAPPGQPRNGQGRGYQSYRPIPSTQAGRGSSGPSSGAGGVSGGEDA